MASANADIDASSLPGLPVMELAQRADSRPPDVSGIPQVCGPSEQAILQQSDRSLLLSNRPLL